MKKKLLIAGVVLIVALLVLAALLVPYRIKHYDFEDGSAKEYQALTYRVVDWDRKLPDEDEAYEMTRIYFGGDVLKSIDDLWAGEAAHIEYQVVARISDYMLDSFLAEPLKGEWEATVSPCISVQFSSADLEKLGADVGSYVEVTYRGLFPEDGVIRPVSVKLAINLPTVEFTGPWLDEETAEHVPVGVVDFKITAIYSNCFFGEDTYSNPYQYKVNGSLSDEWCVGDTVLVSCVNIHRDEQHRRFEGDMTDISPYDPDAMLEDYKPVIYLYPEQEMEISVRLDYNGRLTCTYPAYGDGWTVTAKPDGTLTDDRGQTYNYLYWEGQTNARYDLSEGFCVRGEDTAAFLEEALAKLGLNRREANEFIVYWLPLMEQNPYNVISFQTDCYTEAAKLDIDPAPDTLIRVFMAWQASESYVDLPEQELTAPERQGFTVVEWGGSELK